MMFWIIVIWLAMFGPRAVDDPAIEDAVAFHEGERASRERTLRLVK